MTQHVLRSAGSSRKASARVFVGMALVALILQACAGRGTGQMEAGDRAPRFTLPAASGGEVSLSDYRDRQPVLLYFHMALG